MTANYRILLDVPLEQNLALGFDELATAFQSVIENSPAQFAIGLFGGWGTGKTTLMRGIARRLDHANCAIVWFSAWRYEKEEHLIVPLLDAVREGLVGWHDENATASAQVRQTAKEVAATVGKAIGSLLAGFSLKVGAPGGPELSYDMNKAITRADKYDEADQAARVPRSFYHASFKALQAAFADFVGQNNERRIVVFVDDLDRCLPDGTLEVLEAIKLFFDIPGFVFVVGLDLRVVELSIERRYRDVLSAKGAVPTTGEVLSGANYIRKIFQVPYALAPISVAQIDDFLQSVFTHSDLPQQQVDEVQQKVRPHLRFLFDASGMNPREVKRYINAFTLVRMIKPYLDQDIVLALQTIAFRPDWRAIQFALLAFREAFINALKLQVQQPDGNHLAGLAPDLGSLSQSFLTYLDAGQPGNVLVGAPFDVTDYVFSGEATRSTGNTLLLDLFRDVGALFAAVRDRFAALDLDALAAQLDSVRAGLSNPTGFRATRVGAELSAALAVLRSPETIDARAALGPNPASPDAARAAREQMQRAEEQVSGRLRQAIGQLQELYQAGAI